jgi:hypothetical protein
VILLILSLIVDIVRILDLTKINNRQIIVIWFIFEFIMFPIIIHRMIGGIQRTIVINDIESSKLKRHPYEYHLMLACIIDVFLNCDRGIALCEEPSPERFEILKRRLAFLKHFRLGP